MLAISLTEARANFATLLDRVVADCMPVAITRKGGEGVVLVAASEWTAIEAILSAPLPPPREGPGVGFLSLSDAIRSIDQ